jgi:hypothetical protein
MMYTAETAIPSEASSFIVRVTESQGIDTRASEAPEMYGTVQLPFEATSFTSRVQMSQGIGEAEAEGAAGGEPRTR